MVHKACSDSLEVKVSPKMLWAALVIKPHDFVPKCQPDRVAAVEYEGKVEEVGSVRIVKFHNNVDCITHVKEKLEEVDHEKMLVKFSVIEGGLATVFHNVQIELEFKEGQDAETTILTSKIEYDAEGDEEIPEEQKAAGVALIKSAEAYLLQHPDYA